MDGLRRVIRVDSTSKTLSPYLRVGSIVASSAVIEELARVKMVSGLTTPELDERIVYEVLTATEYRRNVSRLQGRLESAQADATRLLREMGLEPMAQPTGGMFISAVRPNSRLNATEIANRGAEYGILLWAGELFTLNVPDEVWFRLNVSHLKNVKLRDFFCNLPT